MDGFEWWSELEDALDEELVFKLSTWSSLTSVGLQFPTGETYQFDLHFYTEADGADDPFTTLTVRSTNSTAKSIIARQSPFEHMAPTTELQATVFFTVQTTLYTRECLLPYLRVK